MDLNKLKQSNKSIPTNIKKVYLLDLYDTFNKYLNGTRKLICLKYNYNLIISDNMDHLSINDTIENLSNIGKIMCNKPINISELSYFMNEDIYDYLENLQQGDIIDIYSSFYNNYIDPSKINLCQYHHVIDYYILYEKVMPPRVFNFFNTLFLEDDRINDIIEIPNIIMYLSIMCMHSSSSILNNKVVKKVREILNEKS